MSFEPEDAIKKYFFRTFQALVDMARGWFTLTTPTSSAIVSIKPQKLDRAREKPGDYIKIQLRCG